MYSFPKHLLGTYYVPGTGLVAGGGARGMWQGPRGKALGQTGLGLLEAVQGQGPCREPLGSVSAGLGRTSMSPLWQGVR